MKAGQRNLSYFEIFPNAKFDISVEGKGKGPVCADPNCIQTIVKSIFDMCIPPPWLRKEHGSLVEKVVLLAFDGLDVKRFNKNKGHLQNFANLSVNQFPVFVKAKEVNGFIMNGFKTVIGVQSPKMIMKKYNNFEEMLLTKQQMIENGYPVPTTRDTSAPQVITFRNYTIKVLTEEELKSFSELPEETCENPEPIIAIDCEMIDTSNGVELARLSATNIKGVTILDQLFKPIGTVVDYKTQFSGITEETLKNAEISSDEGAKVLAKIANRRTIIIGHSLENDLRAAKLIHYRCIDTAILYAENKRKTALAMLYSKYIKKPFRTGTQESGHDSAEDAKAAAELAQYAIKEPVAPVQEPAKLPDFLFEMLNKHGPVALIDRKERVHFAGIDDRLCLTLTETDKETLDALLVTMKDNDFTIARFTDMNGCSLEEEAEVAACESFNETLKTVIEKSPRRTAIIVYAPNGNFMRLKSINENKIPACNDPNRREEYLSLMQGMLWIHCTDTNKE